GQVLPLSLNVNLSAIQLIRDDVPRQLDEVLRRHGLGGHRFTLELTESAVVNDPDRAARVMAALKELDARLAMDDFGTGYSNLALLQSLPVDVLKIDRSFVTTMLADRDKVAIVRAVLSLAHALGMETTAEGIETIELSQTLAALGCTYGQGFLYAAPLHSAAALDFWSRRQS
ncbi:MAG: GGDEF-domain containing protein, partial [Stutzerimonas stutzeri]